MRERQIEDSPHRIFKTIKERDAYEGFKFVNLKCTVYENNEDITKNGIYRLEKVNGAFIWVTDTVKVNNDRYEYSSWSSDFAGTPSRKAVAEVLNDFDLILNDLTPEKASLITNLTSDAVTYDAMLPYGLPQTWYSLNNPGDRVKIIRNNIFALSFAGFRSGRYNKPDTYGTLSLVIDDVTTDTYEMFKGVGTSTAKMLTVSNITYAGTVKFWSKADMVSNIVQSNEGGKKYNVHHTEAGLSSSLVYFYDNTAIAPTFHTGTDTHTLNMVPNIVNDKWLSGVNYFGMNSSFTVTYGIKNIFHKTYAPDGVASVSCAGMDTEKDKPFTVPAQTDDFLVKDRPITLKKADQIDLNPKLKITAIKPYDPAISSSTFDVRVKLGKGINTYGTMSTDTAEYFVDEARRLKSDGSAWDSTATLPNGQAQVNGDLVYGSTDYPAKAGAQKYERLFKKSAASSITLNFDGVKGKEVFQHGAGDLNMYIHLQTQNRYFDMGSPYGFVNGNGSGDSPANSIGCKTNIGGDARESGVFSLTFGTHGNTALNNGEYKLIVQFNDTTNAKLMKIRSVATS
jgi:hypothetical protein